MRGLHRSGWGFSLSFREFAFGRRLVLGAVLVLLLAVGSVASAFADDWVVTRLRGQVMAEAGGQWVQLKRGDVIPDDRRIQTGAAGRVELVRGKESLALEPNTQIRIVDADGTLKTKVVQAFGVVSVEAERRNVQHFSVQTPVMAAVVKGTRFTVYATKGEARVSVQRGVVQVRDQVHGLITDIVRGQSAAVGAGKTEILSVEGPGPRAPFLNPDGSVVPVEEVLAMAGQDAEPEQAAPAKKVKVEAQIGNGGDNGNGNGSKDGLGLRGSIDVGGLGVNVGGNGNAGNGQGNGGGNGQGNNGNGNGGGNGNAGGNGQGNGGGNGQGNNGNGQGNGGGNGQGNNGNGNGNGGGNGNAGGNGQGNNGNGGGQGNGNGGVGVNIGVSIGGIGVGIGLGL